MDEVITPAQDLASLAIFLEQMIPMQRGIAALLRASAPERVDAPRVCEKTAQVLELVAAILTEIAESAERADLRH